MERVQFQQEQMLAELKDLVQKGLFTQAEIKQIIKKRTLFETALVRRIAKKSDFLRYVAYEMGLEQLRRKRVERLKLPPSPYTISDFALVRRQFQIFERALKKFKSDVGLWLQYIQVAKREGARSLVGRITARALQLHPNNPSLYIIAASHELTHLSHSAARALLQRGLRLNADSVEMWREYVRMELGFVEGIRRRWDVLGISVDGKSEKEKEKEKAMDDLTVEGEMDIDGGAPPVRDETEDMSEDARKAIMNGAIVRSAMDSAVKALPRSELFIALETLLRSYPSPPSLRASLLDHLYSLLQTTLSSDPKAIKMLATRMLRESHLEDTALIDAIRTANEQLIQSIRQAKDTSQDTQESLAQVYAEFIQEWLKPEIDEHLRLYLIASLQSVIHDDAGSSPSLLSRHILTLLSSAHPRPPPAAKALQTARTYTSHSGASRSADVWLARLEAEKKLGGAQKEEVRTAWTSARKEVRGNSQELERVWMWGLDEGLVPPDQMAAALEQLLKESMRDVSLKSVYESLLLRYATMVLQHEGSVDQAREDTTTFGKAAEPALSASASTSSSVPANTANSRPAHTLQSAAGPNASTTSGKATSQAKGKTPDSASAETNTAGSGSTSTARIREIRRIAGAYLVPAHMWARLFEMEIGRVGVVRETVISSRDRASERGGGAGGVGADRLSEFAVLETVYELWRAQDAMEAALGWASWLLRAGRGREAQDVVVRARTVLAGEERGDFDRRWARVLDELSGDGEESDDEDIG